MADRDGVVFLSRFAQCDPELAANCANFCNIIEKGDVTGGGGDAGAAGRIERDGCGGGATVDVKEFVFSQHGHEFAHQRGVGGGFGALMIVDAGYAGNCRDESIDECGDLALRHAGTQLVGFGVALADGFHWEMEQDFIAAAMRFFGDVKGVQIIGKYGDRERIGKSEDGFGGGIVLAEIVEDDGETRSAVRIRSEFDGGNSGFGDVNCMGGNIGVEIFEGEPVTAFDHAASRKFVACCDIIKSLEGEGFVGARCGVGRRRAKCNVDVIGASLRFVCRVERGPSGSV